MRNYKNIEIYQVAEEFVIEIYRLLKSFPKDELYSIVSQLRRASISITSNIAEGASRQHKKEYLNFLYISRGSVAEVESLLSISKRLDYLKEEDYERIKHLLNNLAKGLFYLIKSVEKDT